MITKTQPKKLKRKVKKKVQWVQLGARCTPEENAIISEARKFTHQSRIQFVLQASLERAKAVLAALSASK